jgi:hypothetical protein
MLEFITDTYLSIPMIQIILLMLISTISLLFGKLKLALIINYLFTLHWAYISNRDSLMTMDLEHFGLISTIYFVFGIGVVLVAAFAFMFQKSR